MIAPTLAEASDRTVDELRSPDLEAVADRIPPAIVVPVLLGCSVHDFRRAAQCLLHDGARC